MGRRTGVILLDTHTWLWWISEPEKLSKKASKAVDEADAIGVSAISVWEIAMLELRGRIALDRPPAKWVQAALKFDERLHEVPIGSAIGVQAARLETRGMRSDPADQIIFATAELMRADLVTKDRVLRKFDPKRTVW